MTQHKINISSKYLLQDSTFKQQYENFITTDNIKSVIIKSPCGTGKTVYLSDLVNHYEKVLFISYRISLTQNLQNSFKDFKKYSDFKGKKSDDIINQSKIICSPDSILRIAQNEYNLVVIDEIEGVLNHLSASIDSIDTNKSQIYNTIINLSNKAQKLTILDGDISARSMQFIQHLQPHNSMYIENSYMPKSYNFIQNTDSYQWHKKIRYDLSQGKKVVVVSMASKVCVSLYNKYSQDYRVKIYTAQHGDRTELKDVNNIWNKIDLLTYSPCIEAGVDFNQLYYDSMYVFCSSSNDTTYCSNSQRALYQMIKRIRSLKCSDINIYTGNLPYNENEIPYTYDTVQNIPTVQTIMKKAIFDTPQVKQIAIYNLVENYNRIARLFLRILIPMMIEKGHTWTIEDQEKKIDKSKNEDLNIIARINIKDMPEGDINDLIEKYETEGNIDTTQKFTLEKFYLIKRFPTVDFDDITMIKRYRFKIPNVKFTKNLINDFSNNSKTILSEKQNLGIQFTKDIITHIYGNDWQAQLLDKGKLKINYEYADIAVLKAKLIDFFTNNYNTSLVIFGIDKLKPIQDDDNNLGKDIMGKLTTIFDMYFIKMTSSLYRNKSKGVYTNKGATYEITLDEHVQAILLK